MRLRKANREERRQPRCGFVGRDLDRRCDGGRHRWARSARGALTSVERGDSLPAFTARGEHLARPDAQREACDLDPPHLRCAGCLSWLRGHPIGDGLRFCGAPCAMAHGDAGASR